MNQVCKNVEEKGKLLGYVLSRFRIDVSMKSPFQFFSVFSCFRSPLEVPALLLMFRLTSFTVPQYAILFFRSDFFSHWNHYDTSSIPACNSDVKSWLPPVWGTFRVGYSPAAICFYFETQACNTFGWLATKVLQVSRCRQFWHSDL